MCQVDLSNGNYYDPNQESIPKVANTCVLVPNKFSYSSSIWATNYYSEIKRDQVFNNQQDIAWKVSGTDKDYYSVFADPDLKNDERFQKWVKHYRNGNFQIKGGVGKNTNYFANFLFNGYIKGEIFGYDIFHDFSRFISAGFRGGDETNEQKLDFLRNTIGYQPIPNILGDSVLVGISSNLKNDEEKLKLVETFINELTDSKRVIDFLNIFPNHFPSSARIDINQEEMSEDKKVQSTISKTIASSEVIHPINMPGWVRDVWANVVRKIGVEGGYFTYEEVANAFKTEALNRPEVNHLLVPE